MLKSQSEFVWRVTQVLRQILADGDHLDAVEVSLDNVANDCRFDQIPVLDPILRTGVFFQR